MLKPENESSSSMNVGERKNKHEKDANDITEFHVDFDDVSSPSNRLNLEALLHTIHVLNDCIWCTNLFTKEAEQEKCLKTKYTRSKQRKKLYSIDDARKELMYINIMLDRILQDILPSAENHAEDSALMENTDIPQTSETLKNIEHCGTGDHNNIVREVNDLGKYKTKHCENIVKLPQNLQILNENERDGLFTANIEHDAHQKTLSDSSIILKKLNPLNWDEDLKQKQSKINEKVLLVNNFLATYSKDAFDKYVNSLNEHLISRRNSMATDLVKNPNKRCHSILCETNDIDSLLFDKEKYRIEVIKKNGYNPIEHLCGIALPLEYESFKKDTRATYYGIKRRNFLSISLQTADMTEDIHSTKVKEFFSFFALILSVSLYTLDMVSDVILVVDHYVAGNVGYAALTLIFVVAPLVAETLSKFVLKALGWDKEYGKLKWKDVFNLNDFRVMNWMGSSICYAIKSMKDYGKFASCYAELHFYRCSKGKMEFYTKQVSKNHVDSSHIKTVYKSMLAWNERFTLQTQLAESLNESAPQLMLQLAIIFKENEFDISMATWVSIVTSLLCLSWSMHLAHYNRHYYSGGRVLNNSYKWTGRTVEFFGNMFIYGSRIIIICLAMVLFGWWFFIGAAVYLIIIFFFLITGSKRKEIYRTLHRYKTTIFWPLHRLFTIPYRIGVWRMDSLDHLLFYVETISLAFALHSVVSGFYADVWLLSGLVLALEFIGITIFYIFKRFLHPYGYVCENR